MKSYQERFLKNYKKEVQPAGNKKGYRKVYTYVGDHYTWEPKFMSMTNLRRLFIILEAVTVVLFILATFLGASVNYSLPAMIGALVSGVVWLFEGYGLISFCFRKLPLEEDEFRYVHSVFRITFLVRAVCLLFTVVAGIVYLAEKNFEVTGVLAVTGYFIIALIALYLFALYQKTAKSSKVIPNT